MQRHLKGCEEYLLSTEPPDRPRAEAAICRIYKDLGYIPPQIIWTKSPFESQICKDLINEISENFTSGNCLIKALDNLIRPHSFYYDRHDDIKNSYLYAFANSAWERMTNDQSSIFKSFENPIYEDPDTKILVRIGIAVHRHIIRHRFRPELIEVLLIFIG